MVPLNFRWVHHFLYNSAISPIFKWQLSINIQNNLASSKINYAFSSTYLSKQNVSGSIPLVSQAFKISSCIDLISAVSFIIPFRMICLKVVFSGPIPKLPWGLETGLLSRTIRLFPSPIVSLILEEYSLGYSRAVDPFFVKIFKSVRVTNFASSDIKISQGIV